MLTPTPGSPAHAGYAMPPEWAPHAGTWISWPHNVDTWPGGRLTAAEAAMAQAVCALSAGERVHINVLDEGHAADVRARLEAGGVRSEALRIHVVPTDDAWCRDHGAIFVTRPGADAPLAALDFRFNAWGGKYPPWDRDDAVAGQMADILGVPCFNVDRVLEGGAIEVNGAGSLITTEQCLLNPNRNPGLSRADIEQMLCDQFGVSQVIWLGEGIEGDDTDGHVDDITRFVDTYRVVSAVTTPDDPSHAALADNLARLRQTTLLDGRPLEVIELPSPRHSDEAVGILPASHANFYIGNEVVLMPAFGGASDTAAAAVLARVFPGREVYPIDCRDLVFGLGAFHCLTQQVPAV